VLDALWEYSAHLEADGVLPWEVRGVDLWIPGDRGMVEYYFGRIPLYDFTELSCFQERNLPAQDIDVLLGWRRILVGVSPSGQESVSPAQTSPTHAGG